MKAGRLLIQIVKTSCEKLIAYARIVVGSMISTRYFMPFALFQDYGYGKDHRSGD